MINPTNKGIKIMIRPCPSSSLNRRMTKRSAANCATINKKTAASPEIG